MRHTTTTTSPPSTNAAVCMHVTPGSWYLARSYSTPHARKPIDDGRAAALHGAAVDGDASRVVAEEHVVAGRLHHLQGDQGRGHRRRARQWLRRARVERRSASSAFDACI